jgi:hypothetical protein
MRSMTTHNQSHGEQPGAENDGAIVGAQPQLAELDMSSFSEEQLLAAITGDSPPPQEPSAATPVEHSDGSQTPDDGAQPEPTPANQGQQGKNDSIRLRLSALPPEEQREAAEAYRLVREGKAPDLFEAYKQLRGTKDTDADPNSQQQAAAPPQDAEKPAIISELETQLSDARVRLKEARSTFDADAEDEIEAEIQTLLRNLAKEEFKAEQERKQRSEASNNFQAEYDAAVDELETKFPAVLDDDSEFTRLLDDKVAAARYRKDPKLSDPRYILELAGEVDAILNKPSGRKPSPPPAIPRPNGAQVAPAHNQSPRPSEDQMRAAIANASPEELLAYLASQ